MVKLGKHVARISAACLRIFAPFYVPENDEVEGVVCKASELADNSMKEFPLGEDGGKVLVVKQHGEIFAVGSKCTHYGAPLANGALGEGRVRCPWHGACFNIKSGDIEDFPGLDSLPCYKVEVTSDGDVKVKGKKSDLTVSKRAKQLTCRDPVNSQAIVIIGGGAAGASCVETIRQEGFTGRVVLISKEPHLPYDRPKLSKMLDVDVKKIYLRSEDFYLNNGIEILKGVEATNIDTKGKVVTLSNGESVKYSSVFIASGSRPRTMKVPGSDLNNIFTIRVPEDAKAIFSQLTPKSNVVVVGSSFIGMEAAAFCVGKVNSVVVLGRSSDPFKETLGENVGSRIRHLFENTKGVIMEMNVQVTEFGGKDGKVSSVKLNDGRTLDADVVIVGIGAIFNSEFLSQSEVETTGNGAVQTNEYLQTNVENVYAGGDIAHAPVFAIGNKKAAIGHWQIAHYHGHVAAKNMVGKKTSLRTVPFFWTMLFGMSVRYAGYGGGFDKVEVVHEDILKFVAYYLQKDEVVAIATLGKDPIAAKFAELLYEGKKLTTSDIKDNAWVTAAKA
uniref:Apoptosis-inducing factor 3 n=1 Tax=Bemisia tabaci TaxID=7038 RepID=A0A7S5HFX8_BEMTA|nr:apoptosis-inducing factor 3 [Bemisia tabaci]